MGRQLFFIALASVLWFSCTEAPFFEEMRTYNEGWSAADPATFTFNVADTTEDYQFLLNLRHTEAYPYSNLFVFMELRFPNGKMSVDTLECVLADPRGRWTGRASGNLVDHRIVINPRAIFPLKGEYSVSITQAMRDEVLNEVTDVGFAIEAIKP